MNDKKFSERIRETHEEFSELKECNGYKEYFNLKAKEVKELQDLVQTSMSAQLTSLDVMSMYQPNFNHFITECNE